jgi:hypothetical protein
MWTKKDNGSDVNWNQASDYCSNLQLAGYSDWRLPTIEELQGIYDPSASYRDVLDNGTKWNVPNKESLILTGWHWSSSKDDVPGKPGQEAWQFVFVNNEQQRFALPLSFSFLSRALCVRRSGE